MTDTKQSQGDARVIPQVDRVLRHPLLEDAQKRVRRDVLTELTRRELDGMRKSISQDQSTALPDLDAIAARIVGRADLLLRGGVRRVLNGTGVMLNTNLGRAPVAKGVVERLAEVLPGYCSLEIDLASGKRGERTKILEESLSLLTGCQSAIVVNNNAAAVMLAVSALAWGKEVIISRGELIEIGGSFRLPDVIVAAGGILKEVGTTNRTRLSDYEKATGDKTGLMLKCHRSNFAISGFTEETSLKDLVTLSARTGVPVIEDLGSGALLDLARFGLVDEPTVRSVLQAGADLVLFSGDKLLGGVQSGIVAGKQSFVEKLRQHPIYRALRADKLVIAVLEGAVAQYLTPEPEKVVPLLRMASAPLSGLEERARNLADKLNQVFHLLRAEVTHTRSAYGGGTLPTEILNSFGLRISAPLSSEKLVKKLRTAEPPVVPIVSDDKVILDMRTISADEEALLFKALTDIDKELLRS